MDYRSELLLCAIIGTVSPAWRAPVATVGKRASRVHIIFHASLRSLEKAQTFFYVTDPYEQTNFFRDINNILE